MPEAKKKRRRRWDDPVEPKPEPFTLPPGHYRLKREVVNPQPNRRKTTFKPWLDFDSWPKGMAFIVAEDKVFLPDDETSELRLTTPQMVHRTPLRDRRAQAVLPHLEPSEETPSQWLNRASLGGYKVADGILDVLVSEGKITLADIQSAYKTHFSKRQRAG